MTGQGCGLTSISFNEKLGCTAAMYHQDGRLVAAGGGDGSLHLVQLDRPHAKHQVVREAHKVRRLASCRSVSATPNDIVLIGNNFFFCVWSAE